jgi:hypothetical protein
MEVPVTRSVICTVVLMLHLEDVVLIIRDHHS